MPNHASNTGSQTSQILDEVRFQKFLAQVPEPCTRQELHVIIRDGIAAMMPGLLPMEYWDAHVHREKYVDKLIPLLQKVGRTVRDA